MLAAAELEDLFSRLGALSEEHSAAPLMTLTSGGRVMATDGVDDDFEEPGSGGQAAGQQQLEEWELV